MSAVAESPVSPRPGARVIPIRPVAAGAAASAEDLHEQLLREGWRRQTTIGEPRLSELVENYRAMGYEVRVEGYQASVAGSDTGGCTTCLDAGQDMGQVIGTVYVRKSDAAQGEDELF